MNYLRKITLGLFLWAFVLASGPSGAQVPPSLITEINNNLPSCGTNCINAATLRQTLIDMLTAVFGNFVLGSTQIVYSPKDMTYQGYIGDGTPHPLSSVTTFMGQNSAGWTLAQWQAVLPAAQSLSDELDGDVVNSLIQKATGSVALQFGPTKGRFSWPITTCRQNVSIDGEGWQSSTFTFVNNTNGWSHCQGGGDPYLTTRLELKNFQLSAITPSVAQYGFQGKFQPANNMYWENVQLTNFVNCIQEVHGGGLYLNYVFCNSGQASGVATGIGLDVQGGIADGQQGSFVNHIDNSLMQNYELGYRFYALGVGLEDQRLHNSAAGGVRRCIQMTGNANAAGYSPFEYAFDNFSCDATTQGIDADRAWHLVVRGGDWIVDPPLNGLWTGAGSDYFRICRAFSVNMRDMFVTNNAVALTVASYMRLHNEPTACGIPNPSVPENVQITNNTFEIDNLTYTDAVVAVDSGSVGVLIRDNTFTSFFFPIEPPVNAFRWPGGDNNSALFRNVGLGLTVYNGAVLQPITSNTPFVVGSLSLPPGVWGCSGSIYFAASGSSAFVTVQGAINLNSTSLPAPPGGGMFLQTVNIPNGVNNVFPTSFQTYDTSTATSLQTIYLIGNSQFTGAGAMADGVLQCIRLR